MHEQGNSNGWPNYVGGDDPTWDPSELEIYSMPTYAWKYPGLYLACLACVYVAV